MLPATLEGKNVRLVRDLNWDTISRGGQVSLSRLAHYQEYRRGGADPRYQGLFAPSKYANRVNTDFVSFNYHFLLAELSLVTVWSVCGFAANAL